MQAIWVARRPAQPYGPRMSLRLHPYRVVLAELTACLGSRDGARLDRIERGLDASRGDVIDVRNVVRRSLFEEPPLADLEHETAAHVHAIHHVALSCGATPVICDLAGGTVSGIWDLVQNFPWLIRPKCPLSWLLSGRPFLGDRFAPFGWSYYTYLTKAELVFMTRALERLTSEIPPPYSHSMPSTPDARKIYAATVRDETAAEPLFREALDYGDGETLLYAAWEGLRGGSIAFRERFAETSSAIRRRDDPFSSFRADTSLLLSWASIMVTEGTDAWLIAE